MKSGIHPAYYPAAKIRCSCGNEIIVGATEETLAVEVCSACHPLYTGQHKLVDVGGRIDKFRKRLEAAHVKRRGRTVHRARTRKSHGHATTKHSGTASRT